MSPPTFGSLPNEIVLGIIIRVPFDYDDFLNLRLTNRRINSLMVIRGCQLLEDIAEAQFPIALLASRHPSIPFDKDCGVATLRHLQQFCNTSASVSSTVEVIEVIRKELHNGVPNFKAGLGAQGWKRNLEVALHVMEFPTVPRGERERRDYPRGSRNRINDHFIMVLNHISIGCVLAIRHSVLMGLEALKYLDDGMLAQRIDKDQCAIALNIHSDETLCRVIEAGLGGIMRQIGLGKVEDRFQEESWSFFWQFSEPAVREEGALDRKTRTYLNRRVQEILDDWDNFVLREPKAVAALQQEGDNDMQAVRSLVERFVF